MKVGLIGLGYWGEKIFRNLDAIDGLDIFLCDKNPQLTEIHALECSEGRVVVGNYTLTEMLKEGVEAVIIATNPISTHYELAKEALKAGVSVWLEKPMTLTSEEATELVNLANEKGVILHVDHTFIYSGAVRKIKEIINAGTLGDITNIHMRWLNHGIHQKDVDVVWDLCPHIFSMLNYWFEMPPENIYKAPAYSGEDAHITIDYDAIPGTFQAHIHVSWSYPDKIRECVIIGTDGMLRFDDAAEHKICLYKNCAVHCDDGKVVYVKDRDGTLIEYENTEPLAYECKHFLDCVKEGKETESNGKDGAFVIEMLERC